MEKSFLSLNDADRAVVLALQLPPLFIPLSTSTPGWPHPAFAIYMAAAGLCSLSEAFDLAQVDVGHHAGDCI
jgi:hypothetical protein